MCETCGCQLTDKKDKKVVEINKSILAANNELAQKNRDHFDRLGIKVINLISSPGAGKTTLLEQTAELLGDELSFAVIEGDIETERDAERMREKGIQAVQITTGGACHLDAALIHKGFHELEKQFRENIPSLIFIENVGNLVCPATFYLGEHIRIVMLSVPEGSDKPAKYPKAFSGADLFIISKTDLLPHFDFSKKEALTLAKALNPSLKTICLSAKTGEGMKDWLAFLKKLTY